ncbi:MAG: glycosyltransferase family 39 protein [Bacteroidetes bacterium]|nr:glycosyltransferase family 39 protein [Bacteroidota bacterium]
MIDFFKTSWREKPLPTILWIALLARIPAVIFSKGFGWHDDHFLVIEAAQAWADGTDYNNWLPGSGAAQPDGHSYFYSGIHFVLFKLMNWIHLHDPQSKMYVIRLLHALFSLLIVSFGYKIVRKLSNESSAKIAGVLLALYWFMPFLSVRNLVEFVTIPFLMWGCWKIIDNEKKSAKVFISAGFILGLAVSIRFQSSIFISGILLALLIRKQFRTFLLVAAGSFVSFCILQVPADLIIWKKPFAEFAEYVRYNIANSHSYGKNSWYSYLLLISGILLPPVSFFLWFGFFRTWKKHLLLFLPVFLFLVFHSYFPNKQERFILTIVPFIILLGVAGWDEFEKNSSFWQRNKKLMKGFLIFSISINVLLLPFISTMYSKRARVEAMVYLSKYPDVRFVLMEDRRHETAKMPPEFYLGQWIWVGEVSQTFPIDTIIPVYKKITIDDQPKFVLFCEDYDLEKRVGEMKTLFPALTYETTIQPGFIDDILFRMNPKNANQTIYIYKTRNF